VNLAPGTRLNPYEVVAVLGAGGMGEVYKARDTRLGRTVAITVLPAGVGADPERRRRFEHEARAASALNHPHICTLHDIGSQASPTPGGPPVDYLVMEHLEGQTLAARLATGKLAVPQALEIGTQVADALSAAHKHGIVHRDLKPANVMLTKAAVPGGVSTHAKLLDFGLAKLRAPRLPGGIDSSLPTEAASMTAPGLLLGTLPYMAPEQVEGKDADARTDLWALGLLLYEMLTGKRAFKGTSSASLITAIMGAEPPALATLQPLMPSAVDRLVRKCLAKDPEARWQTATDLADELRWIREGSAGAAGTAVRPPRERVPRLVAGALAVAAVSVALTWLLLPSASLARPALAVSPAEELNTGGWSSPWLPTRGGSRTALTWTPDGRSLVFVGRRAGVQQLYVRPLDAAEARPLPGTEDAQVPAVSADGRWVAFWAGGSIKQVPLSSGPATTLASGIKIPPPSMVWDARGNLYYGWGRIRKLAADGAQTAVTPDVAGETHLLPWPLPGDRALLYTVRTSQSKWGDEEVMAHLFHNGDRKPVLKDAADARYVPATGHLAFLRRGQLFALPFDAERLEKRGPEVLLLDPVAQALVSGNTLDQTGAGQFAIASSGWLAWIPGASADKLSRESSLVVVDRRGQPSALSMHARDYGSGVRVSPDKRHLAVTIQSLTEAGVWLQELGSERLTLRARGTEVSWPIWWPGTQDLVFAWRKGPVSFLARLSAEESEPQVLSAGGGSPSSFSPDGDCLAVLRGGDIWILTLQDGKVVGEAPFQTTPYTERWPEFSPDGRWLAYGSDRTGAGRFEVYLRPYPGPGREELVSIDGGMSPAWSPDGPELFFVGGQAGKRSMMVATFQAGSPPRIGTPRMLFPFDGGERRLLGEPIRNFDVTADGRGFYGVLTGSLPRPPVVTHINLIENWFEELKAKVPTK